jgi:hypothetical protein
MHGLSIILAGLLTVDFGVDSIASSVGKNLEEVVQGVGFVFALSFLDHLSKEIVSVWVDLAFAQLDSLHAFLIADWLQANSSDDFGHSAGQEK